MKFGLRCLSTWIVLTNWNMGFGEDVPYVSPSFLAPVGELVHQSTIPLEWDETKSIAWEAPLVGYGQSSPVMWNDRVYITSVEGKSKESQLVSAFRLVDGQPLWTYRHSTANPGENTDYFSRAAPTSVVNQNGVISWFEAGDVVAIDHGGRLRWKVNLVERFGPIQSRHGLSSSLAQYSNHVFVWVQRDVDPYLLCLHQATGDVLWTKSCPTGIAWSSPILIPVTQSEQHLVLSVSGAAAGPQREAEGNRTPGERPSTEPRPGVIMGLSPVTGETLWHVDGTFGNSTPSPTPVSPGRFLVGASAGREGGPSKEAIATNGLIEVAEKGSHWTASYIWRAERATCGFCSPIAYRGIAYFVDRRGRLFALSLDDGKEIYTSNLGHPVWATPIGVDSRVYFVGEEGITTVLEAGPTFKKLATNELWKTDTAPVDESNPRSMLGRTRQYAAVAIPGAILIRRGDKLYCIR